MTDVDIALVGGSHHQFHTHPLDFIVATPWGIQDGLRAGSAASPARQVPGLGWEAESK